MDSSFGELPINTAEGELNLVPATDVKFASTSEIL
jgi:hypothetical protein